MRLIETDWMLHKAHYEELLQIAARDRLAYQASITRSSRKAPYHEVVKGLATLFTRLGYRLMPSGDLRNALVYSLRWQITQKRS